MANKQLTREEYSAELASLADHLKSNHELGGFQRFWETPNDYQRWTMDNAFWDIVKQFPPLVAAAGKFQKPDGGGRWIWKIVSPELMQSIFGEEADRLAASLNELSTVDWSTRFTHRDRQFQEIEARMLAYRRYREFVAGLQAAGVTQYKTALTDHGLSARELKDLDTFIAGKAGDIDKARNPDAKEPLFEAPKAGRHPRFDDTEYTLYLRELGAKYRDVLESMTGSSGMSLDDTQVERMMAKLEDFDYAEVSATLGAQKRWPPQDEHGLNAKTYELLAKLPQAFARAFEEQTAKAIQDAIQNSLQLFKSSEASSRSWAFDRLRHLKNLLRWLSRKIPIESQAFIDARTAIAREFDPRWAAMSAGPLHEEYMGQIRFSDSNALPLTGEWPQTLNPARDCIYAHVFLDKAIKDVATGNMLFVEAGDQRYQFGLQALPGDSAYLCVSVLPENGRNPDLIRTLGKALLAATGELEFVVTPIVERSAVGTLRMKMSKADAARLPARIEELAAKADANRTAAAVLPESFAKGQKWPYKDEVLTPERVRAAIETAWAHNRGEEIDVLHMRVNHYRPGYEWDLEVGPLQVPVARLVFSYIGIVFQHKGKVFAVEDGIQVRQFWKGFGQGYGDDLNILFWGAKPFQLSPEQVQRIVK
ncbi:hypothetical protein [Ramlibacter sp. Leaf400]|uniref:hypothetical protein n=1 Tax=Ramlibacter sp. Leaf400 TaxID=1736365 RepID=UPI000701A7B4|nr:hypothetical protein [Ramlibacter sp. Leaf400]KQT09379.1 hypothetical protein ASG30_12455 [Ramlibacter sp. Leaf400]